MHETIIDWRGRAAGLTLGDLLDDSYLDAPADQALHAPARSMAAFRQTASGRLVQARPALRHLMD